MAVPTPPPRVVPLRPRVADLRVRVLDLEPRRSRNAYTVDSDVLFAFGSARLSGAAASVLDDVVTTLRAKKPTRVTVTGYTDSIGATGYNRALSERRATAVRAYLKRRAAGPAYTVRGRGEAHPVAPNEHPDGTDNPDGRRKNRRVVITYTNPGG